MAGSTFQTNPYDLSKLLDDCHRGVLQLPDFQRSWVWDEDRIKSLIASISRAFPVGALMTLDTGGDVNFKPRPVEGAPVGAKDVKPLSLLLDGQQRMTSLYQVTMRGKVVETVTPKKKKVKRWFYIDIRKALDPAVDREDGDVIDAYVTGAIPAHIQPLRASQAVSGKTGPSDLLMVRRTRWGTAVVVTSLGAAVLGLAAVALLIVAVMTEMLG